MKDGMRLIAKKAGACGGKIKGIFRMAGRKAIICGVVGLILCLLVGYVGSGLVVVGPNSVNVVRCPERLESAKSLILFEKPIAFINDTDGAKIYLAWPRIPGTNIGAREETYSLDEPIAVSQKIALFNLAAITGDPADAGKVAYLVVSAGFEVIDWETFLTEFDPTMATEDLQSKTRSEILANNIAMYLFRGNVENWFNESMARTYIAHSLVQEYDLQTEQDVEYFIKVYRSWYWALGAMYFHYFEEEILRNPSPDNSTQELATVCVMAATAENAIDFNMQKLGLLMAQEKAFCEELNPATIKRAETILNNFKKYLEEKDMVWPVADAKKELSEFLVKSQMNGEKYTPEELYIARTIVDLETAIDNTRENIAYFNENASRFREYFKNLRLWSSAGNDSLWKFAIKRAVIDEEMPGPAEFYSWLKIDGMEYLKELARFYNDDLELFKSSGIKLANISFSIDEVVETGAPVK